MTNVGTCTLSVGGLASSQLGLGPVSCMLSRNSWPWAMTFGSGFFLCEVGIGVLLSVAPGVSVKDRVLEDPIQASPGDRETVTEKGH